MVGRISIRGFTVIELIIIIALLAILAATALPKFINMSAQIRKAEVASWGSELASKVSIAHTQWIANDNPTIINLEGNSIVMSTQGWPEAIDGIANGMATAAKCLAIWNQLLNTPPMASTKNTEPCQFLVTVLDDSICQFIDQQSNGANIIKYNITTGAVSL